MKTGIVLLITFFSIGASAGFKVVGVSHKTQADVKKTAEEIGRHILGILNDNPTPEEFREAIKKRQQQFGFVQGGGFGIKNQDDVKKAIELIGDNLGLSDNATPEEFREAIKKRQQQLSSVGEGFGISSQDDVKKATEIIGLRTLGLPDNPTPEEFLEALRKKNREGGLAIPNQRGIANVQGRPGKEILNENLPPAYINRLKNGGNCSYVDESGPVYIKTNRCGGICIGEIDCDNIRAGSFRVIHTAVCASEGEDCPSAKKCLATKRPKTIVEGGRIETLKARRELLKKDTDERVNRLKKTINESSGQGGALQ